MPHTVMLSFVFFFAMLQESMGVSQMPWPWQFMKQKDDTPFQNTICLEKLAQALGKIPMAWGNSSNTFADPRPGFVVSAGPPPDGDDKQPNAPNSAYVANHILNYWNFLDHDWCGGPGVDLGTEKGRQICIDGHYDSLREYLADYTTFEAQGVYEGEKEKSWIVYSSGKKDISRGLIDSLIREYDQDSILEFGPTFDLGSNQHEARRIKLIFGSSHRDQDTGDPQPEMDLGVIRKYGKLEDIPTDKQFAYTQVGDAFYAGADLVDSDNYLKETADCLKKKGTTTIHWR